MSKFFLTGGSAGSWKKAKVSNLLPFQFDVEVTNDQETGNLIATTDTTFAEVKAAVLAKRTVEAICKLPDTTARVHVPVSMKNDDDPTVITFSACVDMEAGEATPDIHIYTLTFSSDYGIQAADTSV